MGVGLAHHLKKAGSGQVLYDMYGYVSFKKGTPLGMFVGGLFGHKWVSSCISILVCSSSFG